MTNDNSPKFHIGPDGKEYPSADTISKPGRIEDVYKHFPKEQADQMVKAFEEAKKRQNELVEAFENAKKEV